MSFPPAANTATLSPGARFASAAARWSDGALAVARDPMRLVIFALIVLNVSRVHQAYPFMARFRPALLLVFAAAAYAFLNTRFLTRVNVMSFWPARRVALLGLVACASAVFGLSLGGSGRFILENYSKTLIFFTLVVLSVRDVRDLYTFMWAYAVSCGVLSFMSLVMFGITPARSGDQIARLADMYTYDANDVCVVLLVGLGVVLGLLTVVRGSARWALYAILFGIAATIAKSGSRGGFLGLVAFGLGALLLLDSVSFIRRIAVLGGVLVGLSAFAPDGYWKKMASVMSPKDDYNYSSQDGRKELARRGIRYMTKFPVFGVGINNFSKAECQLSRETFGVGRIRCGAPHNSFVQAGAETGFTGLLMFVSIVLGGIWSLLRVRRRLPRAWRRGNQAERLLFNAPNALALALIGFAVSAFFVTFAWTDILYVLIGLIGGLYTSLKVYADSSQADPNPQSAASQLPPRGSKGWRVFASAERAAAARQIRPAPGTT
ncbi:MAG TPA: O-antigen ligase family protein [Gemmatimonadaceae bacterium]|nr:O-antigen ligase family protein [Gemmatimonadaceae bacterium]